MALNLVVLGVAASVVVAPPKPVSYPESVKCDRGVYSFDCTQFNKAKQQGKYPSQPKRFRPCPLIKNLSGRYVCDER